MGLFTRLLFALTAAAALLLAFGVLSVVIHAVVRSASATLGLYRRHFRDVRRERLFLGSVGFFLTVLVVRSITLMIHLGVGGLHDVQVGGTHVHHLVWGILLLLAVGYVWLAQLGAGTAGASRWASRVTAFAYGVGSGLTLDEFALWLRLEDVYWTREGRASIEAVLLFGAVLSVGLWGGRFFRALVREATETRHE